MAADTMMSAMNVVGATLRSEKYDGSNNNGFSDSEVHVKWQASSMGIESGYPNSK